MSKTLPQIPRDINLIIIGTGIMLLFWGPVNAYYSLFLKSFASDYSQIGWLLSLSQMIPLLLAIPIGIMANRFSSRHMLILATTAFLFIPLLYFYAGIYSTIGVLMFAILIESIFKLLLNISITTYIKAATPAHLNIQVWSKNLAITTSLWGIGLALSSLLIIYFSIPYFFLLIIIGAAISIILFLKTKEIPSTFHQDYPEVHKLTLIGRVKRGLTHFNQVNIEVKYMLLTLIVFGFTAGNIDVFLVLFADSINLDHRLIGLLMGFIYISFILAIPINKITVKIGKFHSMYTGQILMILAMLTVFYFAQSNIWVIFIAFFIHWLSFLLIKPVRDGIIAAYTPADLQGEVSGIQQFLITIGIILGAIFFGYISQYLGLKWVFLIIAFIYTILAIFFIWLAYKYEHKIKDITIHPHQLLSIHQRH